MKSLNGINKLVQFMLAALVIQGCAKGQLTQTKEVSQFNVEHGVEMASLADNGQVVSSSRITSIDFSRSVLDMPAQLQAAEDQFESPSIAPAPGSSLSMPPVAEMQYRLDLISGMLRDRRAGKARKLSDSEMNSVMRALKGSAYLRTRRSACGMPIHGFNNYAVLRGSTNLPLNLISFRCGGTDLVKRNTRQRTGFNRVLDALLANNNDGGVIIPIIDDIVPQTKNPVIRVTHWDAPVSTDRKYVVAKVCSYQLVAYTQNVAENSEANPGVIADQRPRPGRPPGLENCVEFGRQDNDSSTSKNTQLANKVFDLLDGQTLTGTDLRCEIGSTAWIVITSQEGKTFRLTSSCDTVYKFATIKELFAAMF